MDWMDSKPKHNGSLTPSKHSSPPPPPPPSPPGTPPSPWPEAPLCEPPPLFLHPHSPPALCPHPSPCSPLLCQTCERSIHPPSPPRSPPHRHWPPPCSRLLRSRLAVAPRRRCVPPPASSPLSCFLPDPAAPTPSQVRSHSSTARSPRTSASSIHPRHRTLSGPYLLSLSHSFPPVVQQWSLQLHPPPSSRGQCPSLHLHPCSVLHPRLPSPTTHLLLRPCLWHLPPPSHLPLPLASSLLHQGANRPSSGSLSTMIWISQQKHHTSTSSLPIPFRPKLRLLALCLTRSPTGCPRPLRHSRPSLLPSPPELQLLTPNSQRVPVTAASSPGSRQKDRITLNM